MQLVPLQAIANQQIIINLDAVQFVITVREGNGVMLADVNIDGADVVTGAAILAGEPVIPYAYLQTGNFVLATADDDLPFWTEFGASQALYYLTDAEMAA